MDVQRIRHYLGNLKVAENTYSNHLKALRHLFQFLDRPDLVESFRQPSIFPTPPNVPGDKEIRRAYEALDDSRERALFLFYASTGLRKDEVLHLELEDVDLESRIVKPNNHNGSSKHTWITCFNNEALEALKDYLSMRSVRKDRADKLFVISDKDFDTIWTKIRTKTGLRITAKSLRSWFASEMASLSVPDRYVDAFCGRAPKSVLARHYSDYSAQRLKEIYDKAGLEVLS